MHGVPRASALPLAAELSRIVRDGGAVPALVGVVSGRAVVGMSDRELQEMLDASSTAAGVPKLNTANVGVAMHRGWSGATTVSTTMELASAAGVRVFATGGLGGVHEGVAESLDISSDLAAFTRFPVAVVTAGVKSILNVAATREALETLGIPVIGYRTDDFPAFYLRKTDPPLKVDARFDDIGDLALYVRSELIRSGRGIVIANPIPAEHELPVAEWNTWLAEARRLAAAAGASGRGVTPAVLGRLHEVSGGRTLAANIELVKHNAMVAAQLAAAMVAPARAG